MGDALDTVTRVIAAFDADDETAVMALLHENLIVEAPGGVRIEGREAGAGYSAAILAAFDEVDVDTHLLAEQGELVAEEYTLTATHTGVLRDPDGTEYPPTGRRVTLRIVEIYRVQNSLITENRLYYDPTRLRDQVSRLRTGS